MSFTLSSMQIPPFSQDSASRPGAVTMCELHNSANAGARRLQTISPQKLRLSVPDDFVFTSHGFRSFAASLGVDHSLSVHNLMALANHKNAKSLEGYIAKNSKRRLEKNAEQLWTGVRK